MTGLITAAAVSRIAISQAGSTAAVRAWPGPALAIAGAGLLLAVVAAGEQVPGLLRAGRWRSPAGLAVIGLGAVACSAPALAAAHWVTSGVTGPVRPAAGTLLPEFVAVSSDTGQRLRTPDWTPVLPVDSLEDGKPQRVEVDGVGLVVCRTGNNGDVAAFGEFCPHLAAPMSDGWVDRGRLVCPWHGSRFDICSGAVLRGPSAAPLPRYETRINDGMIELRGDTGHLLPAGKGVAK